MDIYESYQRGASLQYGNLGEIIEQNQLYQDARAIGPGHIENRKNLFLLFYFF